MTYRSMATLSVPFGHAQLLATLIQDARFWTAIQASERASAMNEALLTPIMVSHCEKTTRVDRRLCDQCCLPILLAG